MLWIQGIFQRDMSYGFKPLQKQLYDELMDYKKLIVPQTQHSMTDNVSSSTRRSRFCAISTKSFFSSRYFLDALFRHVLVHMLANRYPQLPKCTSIGGYHDHEVNDSSLSCNVYNPKYKQYGPTTSHHLLPLCFQDFMFTVNFENTITYGYTSEKIYTGLLGGSIPVYLGNIEIKELINLDRVIYCDLTRFYDDEYIASKRKEFSDLKMRKFFDESENTHHKRPGYDEPKMLQWVQSMFQKGMEACVDEIAKVYQNTSLYEWKICSHFKIFQIPTFSLIRPTNKHTKNKKKTNLFPSPVFFFFLNESREQAIMIITTMNKHTVVFNPKKRGQHCD
ncbi:hypothetical protein RFI_23455 [Reticulomyxa filosa]|uniref:Uncharacterized protein n=1 Tax=Reticulomyxa filosa TaxID=46433 RepID=X6MLI9_RETFI|nr:hypothetical protein RFI_23455 [Reticulomyxa filosa]|eukprot:ETO13915.1 hypothetical protein RFI_23455 [Reticulomyxa filosa]